MNEIANNSSDDAQLERIASALANGLIVVDRAGQIVWMDESTRRRINGGLQHLSLPLARADQPSMDCFLAATELMIEGERTTLCVLQESDESKDLGHDLIAAVEAVMSDSSWFTRTIVEKFKAWRQAKQPALPALRPSDLDQLTHREREIMALICEGKSDADMSRSLGLSHNTVRNHVASLYRKIGVNRRSAAVIWARERALTSQEFVAVKSRGRFTIERDRG
jgi:DNA-binding CsgD family transcriptional regulator